MAEVSGKEARIRYTSVTGTSSTDNAATRTTGTTGTGYVQIDSTAKRHWDRTSTGFVLYRTAGGSTSAVSSTNYTINYVQGKFEWRTGDPSTGTYTIDAIHVTSSYLTGGREWTLDAETNMLETTSFSTSTANAQWRTFVPGLSQASASITRLHSSGDTGPVFYDRLNLPAAVIVELVMTPNTRFEGYGWVAADGFEAGIDDLVTESVEIQIDGPLYYSTT